MSNINTGFGIATIANGASLSDAVAVGNRKLLALYVPTMTSCVLSFDVSYDGATFYALYDVLAVEVTIPAGTHNKAYAAPLELLGIPFIKVRSGIIGALTNQGAARSVVLGVSGF